MRRVTHNIIGSEYFSMGDDEAEYRIILPFDADIEHYFGNPEYVMQKKNVTIIFCEDPSYASKIQMHVNVNEYLSQVGTNI